MAVAHVLVGEIMSIIMSMIVISVLTSVSALYGSYHKGQLSGQRKPVQTVGQVSISNHQLSHIGFVV